MQVKLFLGSPSYSSRDDPHWDISFNMNEYDWAVPVRPIMILRWMGWYRGTLSCSQFLQMM